MVWIIRLEIVQTEHRKQDPIRSTHRRCGGRVDGIVTCVGCRNSRNTGSRGQYTGTSWGRWWSCRCWWRSITSMTRMIWIDWDVEMLTNSLDTRSGHEIWLKDSVGRARRDRCKVKWVDNIIMWVQDAWCEEDTASFLYTGCQWPPSSNHHSLHSPGSTSILYHSYVSGIIILTVPFRPSCSQGVTRDAREHAPKVFILHLNIA